MTLADELNAPTPCDSDEDCSYDDMEKCGTLKDLEGNILKESLCVP